MLSSYCLKKKKGVQECRFGYPKPLQPVTTIDIGRQHTNTADTAQRLPPQQLQSRAAFGMACQCGHAVHRVTKQVLNYIAKYAAKSEPRSKGLKAVYGNVLKTLKSDGSSLKMVQKLMISSVGERDYSAQETCHLLLGLPMYSASRDFVILSLDGSRQVDNDQEEGTAVVTLASQLDHYRSRPTTPHMEDSLSWNLCRGTGCPRVLVWTQSAGRRKSL